MRTAIMVLVCHPYYQCTFGECWSDITLTFAIAAYFSIVTLLVFGLGVPVFATAVLVGRRSQLSMAFTDSVYKDKYLEEGTVGNRIALRHWIRFLSSDDSLLSPMYDQLEPQWVFYLPLLLLCKLGLLIPPITIEPSTLSQIIGIGVAEAIFALIIIVTSPYMSPWVDLMNRVGSAHQLALLGLQALYVTDEFKAVSRSIPTYMIALTSTYIIFVILCLLFVVILPLAQPRLIELRTRRTAARFGFAATRLAPMYVVPSPPVEVRSPTAVPSGTMRVDSLGSFVARS